VSKYFNLLPLTLAVSFLMTGCVETPAHSVIEHAEYLPSTVDAVYPDQPPEVSEPVKVVEYPPHKLVTSMGYGTVDKTNNFSKSQMKLMAMRASKMDAYRTLVEQIYGIQLDGSTTVENMVVKNDRYRGFIRAYLRGAKVTRSTLLSSDDFTYETVMEIDLSPRFFECLKGKAIYNQCI
jgi:hypothetical protein